MLLKPISKNIPIKKINSYQPAKTYKIGIFDSGVGGFGIEPALFKKIPRAHFYYLLDNKNFPYGTKEENFLHQTTVPLIDSFIKKFDLDLLVVACNTASTRILEDLRALNPAVPIVGVVPAIKTAAELTKTKVIGVLATEATVKSLYTKDLVKEFASHCSVKLVGSTRLVELAEKKLRGDSLNLNLVKEAVLDLLLTPNLDTVTLACTHFLHLKQELNKLSDGKISWIDCSEAIANRVLSLLSIEKQNDKKKTLHNKTFLFVTKSDFKNFKKLSKNLKTLNIKKIALYAQSIK